MSNPDLIVVGSGLTGLLAAKSAKNQGLSVRVLEAREVLGGCLRPVETKGLRLPTGLQFLPAHNDSLAFLAQLQILLEMELNPAEESARTLTFETGDFKNFIGFGEASSASINELARFNSAQRFGVTSAADVWIEKLLQGFSEDELSPLTEVTRLAVANGRITGVEINGAKSLSADKILYTGSTSGLEKLLPDESIAPRTRSRLAKAKGLTSISLHFAHSVSQTMEMGYHFLTGTGADFEPFVGRFFPATETLQASTWMALVPEERSDEESIGDVIRYMKRQIKRAYPQALEKLAAEKLVIADESHGAFDAKLKDPGVFAEIENLFVATARTSTQPGLMAALERGFHGAQWVTGQAIPVAASEPVCYSPSN